MGPPLWNLSINQLLARKPVGCASGLGEAAGEAVAAAGAAGLAATPGAGLSVTGTDAPGAAGWPQLQALRALLPGELRAEMFVVAREIALAKSAQMRVRLGRQ